MELNGVEIEDTFCEAFGAVFTRILVTAINEKWVKIAGQIATGYGTSTIHCDAEAGVDVYVPADKTPDNRPGVTLMFFKTKKDKMDQVLLNRIGQCVLTCPTTACFDALNTSLVPEKVFEIKTGYKLKFFGDKFEEKIEGSYPFKHGKFLLWMGNLKCRVFSKSERELPEEIS